MGRYWRRLFDEAPAQLVGHPDAPRRAWGELFADDDPGDQPAMQRGRCHAEDLGRLRDGDELAIGALGWWFTARDAAIAAQVTHVSRAEAVAARGASALAIEDAGDDGVGVMRGEALDEREAVFVGANPWRVGVRQADLEWGDGAAAPAQGEVRAGFGPLDGNHDVLEQRAQQFLLVARRGGGGVPDAREVVTERAKTFRVGGTHRTRALGLAAGQVALRLVEFPQPSLPVGFESTRDQPILGLHRAIASFGPFGFVPGPFNGEAPLCERGVVVRFDLVRRHERGVQGRWREGREEGRGHGLVDLEPADVEAVDAAPINQVFAGAVIAGRGMAAVIMGVQAPAAAAARREALQQRRAFSRPRCPPDGVGDARCSRGAPDWPHRSPSQ
jgi:hypothetical protein